MIFSGHILRGVIAGSCCLFLLVWSQLMNEGNSTSTAWSRGKKINLMNSGCEGKMCSESLFHGEGRRKKAVKLLPSSVWSKIRLDVGFPAGVKEALCYISPGWPCSVGKGTVWRPLPSPALRSLCLGALRLCLSQQNTPIYKASFYLNLCPSCELFSPRVNEAKLL